MVGPDRYSAQESEGGKPRPVMVGFLSAERARRVLLNIEYPEFQIKGIVEQQTTRQRVSYAEYELEHFSGLDQANLPGHNAQDPDLTSGRDQPVPWRSGPDTAQTRPAARRVK